MNPDGSTNPTSPEEKLLRLIRGKDAPASRPAAAVAPPRPTSEPAARAAAVSRGTARRRPPPLPWPRLAAIGLGVVVGLEAVGVLIQALRPLPVIQASAAPAAAQPQVAPDDPTPLDGIPSLADGMTRPVFTAPAEAVAASTLAAPSASAKQLAARLTLMGIVSGDPAQAIIEDAQTKKTHFVTTGQAVVEGAVVEQISDNRVVLNLQGERVELTL